jgi:hypothetical protein
MNDNEFPTSLGEARAIKLGSADAWTPIEMVESFLADLKSGKFDPDEVTIVFRETAKSSAGYRRSGKDRHAAAGILLDTANMLAK